MHASQANVMRRLKRGAAGPIGLIEALVTFIVVVTLSALEERIDFVYR